MVMLEAGAFTACGVRRERWEEIWSAQKYTSQGPYDPLLEIPFFCRVLTPAMILGIKAKT